MFSVNLKMMIEEVLDKFFSLVYLISFPYKVVGQNYDVHREKDSWGNDIFRLENSNYWSKRFRTSKEAEEFIEIGRSPSRLEVHNSGLYSRRDLALLRKENEGKTYIVWDDFLGSWI